MSFSKIRPLTLSLPLAIIIGFCKQDRSRWDGSYEPSHLDLCCLTFSLSTLHINFFSNDSLLKEKQMTYVIWNLAQKKLIYRAGGHKVGSSEVYFWLSCLKNPSIMSLGIFLVIYLTYIVWVIRVWDNGRTLYMYTYMTTIIYSKFNHFQRAFGIGCTWKKHGNKFIIQFIVTKGKPDSLSRETTISKTDLLPSKKGPFLKKRFFSFIVDPFYRNA